MGTTGTRIRDKSPSVIRKVDEAEADDGWKKPGRQRQRKTAAGTSKVQIEDVGEYIAPAEFYIGNTDGRTNEETIKTVLMRCAAAVEGGENLVVEKVELLTKEQNPRTKCWKVVVPFRFKGVMEKDDVYPAGWKHRSFFGSRNSKDKKPRIDQGNNVEQQVLREQEERTAQQTKQQEEQLALQKRMDQLEGRMTNPSMESENSG